MARSIVRWRARRLQRSRRYADCIRLLSDDAARTDDAEVLCELVRARRDGFAQSSWERGRDDWPPPRGDRFPPGGAPSEIRREHLDATTLGAGILDHGSLLVRGLIDQASATDLASTFERAFAAEAEPAGDEAAYTPMGVGDAERPDVERHRRWVHQTRCLWLGDSPRALFRTLQAFDRAGLADVLTEHFGERPVFSLEKSTLRRAGPEAEPEWHQDGAFMGPSLRTVNVWVALTPCGGDADVPGLDVVPRRFDAFVETGTRGAKLDTFVGPGLVEELAREAPVVRPTFAPGDALIFDDHCLHATGASPGMTGDRLAIEMWFFAPSTVPARYVPMLW